MTARRFASFVSFAPFVSLVCLVFFVSQVEGAELKPHTVRAWDAYVRQVEARRAAEDRGGYVVPAAAGPAGEIVDVEDGLINHWRAVVVVPGRSVEGAIARLRLPAAHRQEDVLVARELERRGDWSRIYLKLVRHKIVTVTYNTEHEVQFTWLAPGQVVSRSVATKIAELDRVGEVDEREKSMAEDRGFLWRLNAYWRYQDVPGGVRIELESITLSRDIPSVVKFVARPIIASIARESITRTLDSLRGRLAN